MSSTSDTAVVVVNDSSSILISTSLVTKSSSEESKVLNDSNDSNEVSILWWPRPRTKYFTHVRLSIGQTVWDCTQGYRLSHSTLSQFLQRSDPIEKGRPLYRYVLNLESAEINRLVQYLNSHPAASEWNQHCLKGLCKALNTTTRFKMRSFIPTPCMGYLSLGYKLNCWGNIKRIEFSGSKSRCSAAVVCGSPGVWFDMFATLLVVILIIGILYLIPSTIIRLVS